MVWVLYFHCSIPFGSLRAAHEWGRAAPWPPETPRPGQGSCQRSQGGSEPAVSDRGRTTALAHAWKCKRRHATRGPGLPASPPPHRLLGDRGAVAARRPRRGRGKEGTTRLGAGEAAARSPRAGRGGGKRGEGKQRGRPFSYRGFLRNHGNDARPCACASRGAGRAAAPWPGPAHRRRSLWRGRGVRVCGAPDLPAPPRPTGPS